MWLVGSHSPQRTKGHQIHKVWKPHIRQMDSHECCCGYGRWDNEEEVAAEGAKPVRD